MKILIENDKETMLFYKATVDKETADLVKSMLKVLIKLKGD